MSFQFLEPLQMVDNSIKKCGLTSGPACINQKTWDWPSQDRCKTREMLLPNYCTFRHLLNLWQSMPRSPHSSPEMLLCRSRSSLTVEILGCATCKIPPWKWTQRMDIFLLYGTRSLHGMLVPLHFCFAIGEGSIESNKCSIQMRSLVWKLHTNPSEEQSPWCTCGLLLGQDNLHYQSVTDTCPSRPSCTCPGGQC